MSYVTIGIDPGHIGGAAVMLDGRGRTAIAAWSWTRRPKAEREHRYDLVEVRFGEVAEGVKGAPSMHAVACRISAVLGSSTPYVVCVEDLFVPHVPATFPGGSRGRRGKHNPHERGTISRAEAAAYEGQIRNLFQLVGARSAILGPIGGEPEAVLTVHASKWRHEVLGLAVNTSSDDAEAEAIRRMNVGRPVLVEGLGTLANDPHVAEAACIAVWGHTAHRDAVRAAAALEGRS